MKKKQGDLRVHIDLCTYIQEDEREIEKKLSKQIDSLQAKVQNQNGYILLNIQMRMLLT